VLGVIAWQTFFLLIVLGAVGLILVLAVTLAVLLRRWSPRAEEEDSR
jgi:membrane protein implicated in regulation of membrane protease activity